MGFYFTIGFKKDGTILVAGNSVKDWKDIVAISAGPEFDCNVIGIKRDGSIVSSGCNKYGECNVESWGNQKGNK